MTDGERGARTEERAESAPVPSVSIVPNLRADSRRGGPDRRTRWWPLHITVGWFPGHIPVLRVPAHPSALIRVHSLPVRRGHRCGYVDAWRMDGWREGCYSETPAENFCTRRRQSLRRANSWLCRHWGRNERDLRYRKE